MSCASRNSDCHGFVYRRRGPHLSAQTRRAQREQYHAVNFHALHKESTTVAMRAPVTGHSTAQLPALNCHSQKLRIRRHRGVWEMDSYERGVSRLPR